MKSQEGGFLKKTGKAIKYGTMGLVATGMLTHAISQEDPKVQAKETITIEAVDSIYAKFSPETREELAALEDDYAKYYASNFYDLEEYHITQEDLKNRFKNLVAKYGDGIKVVFPDSENKSVGDRVIDFTFTKVLRQNENRAHYAANRLFYANTPTEKEVMDNGDTVVTGSARLNNFIAEFSHHINNDFKPGRIAHYAEGLVSKGFNQYDMYEDASSVEFQAHHVTEEAINAYLYAQPKDFKISFEKIRGSYNDLYVEVKQRFPNLNDSQLGEVMSVYVHQTANELESLDYKKEQMTQRLSKLNSFAETYAMNNNLNTKEVVNSIVNWDVIDVDAGKGWYIPDSLINEYAHTKLLMDDVVQKITKKDFTGFAQMASDPVLEKHPEFYTYMSYSKKGNTGAEITKWMEFEAKYEKSFESSSIAESREYVKQVIPFLKKITHDIENRYATEPVPDALYDEVRDEIIRAMKSERGIMDRAGYSQADIKTSKELSVIVDQMRNVYTNSRR